MKFLIETIALGIAGILCCHIPEDMPRYQVAMYMILYYILIRGGIGIAAEIIAERRKQHEGQVEGL